MPDFTDDTQRISYNRWHKCWMGVLRPQYNEITPKQRRSVSQTMRDNKAPDVTLPEFPWKDTDQ